MNRALDAPSRDCRTRIDRLAVLIKREFWEHRELLWVPVVICGLHLGLALAALVVPQHLHGNVDLVRHSEQSLFQDSQDSGASTTVTRRVDLENLTLPYLFQLVEATPLADRTRFLQQVSLGHGRVTLAIGGFLLLILLGRMQQREQQSRSSMFFHSMPLTAWEYLGAKWLTAVPVGLALLLATIVLSQLAWLLVFSGAALAYGHSPWSLFWQPAHPAVLWSTLTLQTVVDTLWMLPGLGFTLLWGSLGLQARSSQRNSLICGAVLIGAVLLDVLYLTGGQLWHWVLRHVLPAGMGWEARALPSAARLLGQQPGTGGALDLWLGVALGLAMFWTAVKVLHWREER
jgi:hypothetical protein